MGDCSYPACDGTLPFYGGQFSPPGGSYGGPPFQSQVLSYLSSGSTDDHWHLFNFPGGLPLVVPTFIHGPSPPRPSHGGSPMRLHLWRPRLLLRLPPCIL